MLRKIWRRLWSPAVWAFALVLAAPLLASAQQTGLFPLAPIRRERVPCPMEDPVYGLYRSQYYGYFPTCWRRFPPGWGCPSPEAPNPAQSFAEIKRDELPPVEEAPPEEGGGPEGPARPAPGGELEPLPGGRGPAIPSPEQLPPVPGGNRSPFELEKPRPAPGPSNPNGTAPAPAEPGTAPSLNPPGDRDESPTRPGSGTAARLAPTPTPALAPTPPPTIPSPSVPTAPAERGDVLGSGPESSSPLLALPDPSGPSASTVPPGGGTPVESSGPPSLPSPTLMTPPEASTAPPAPVQAPRRLSVLGNLFNAIGLKRR